LLLLERTFNSSPAKIRVGEVTGWRAIDDRFVAVPELTRGSGIKLNERV
jgi:hypothetical protein